MATPVVHCFSKEELSVLLVGREDLSDRILQSISEHRVTPTGFDSIFEIKYDKTFIIIKILVNAVLNQFLISDT